MTKHLWTIAILLLGLVPVARGQETPSGGLSNVDKAAIIDAVLTVESRNESSIPFYGTLRRVSSENIEFIERSQLSNHGFSYFPAIDIMLLKRDHVIDYLRFNQILLRDGVVVVTLSRVTEGRPCFAGSFSREKRYTYKARQTVVCWIAELTQSPASPLSFPPLSFSRKVFPRR